MGGKYGKEEPRTYSEHWHVETPHALFVGIEPDGIDHWLITKTQEREEYKGEHKMIEKEAERGECTRKAQEDKEDPLSVTLAVIYIHLFERH